VIATIIKRRCRFAWAQNRALCGIGMLLMGAVVCGCVGWALFPERKPFSIESNDQFKKSAYFVVGSLGCLIAAVLLLVYDIDRRWHRRQPK